MSFWRTWLRKPQATWLRKATFQIHLWSGIILGIYIVVVCASGSVIVFRNDFYDILLAKLQVKPNGILLKKDALRQQAERTYPGRRVGAIRPGRDEQEAAEVTLAGTLVDDHRIMDPYTGRDLGPGVQRWFKILNWSSDLHGRLLLGAEGMTANAIGGILLMAVCVTGLVIWWPGLRTGVSTWRRALVLRRLVLRRGVGWKRFIWDLHGVTGFWLFGILFMWGFTGAYFVFPDPVRAVVNYFTPILPPPLPAQQQAASGAQSNAPVPFPQPPRPRRRRPLTLGGKILRDFSYAHYGNFGGWPVKLLWVILGFLPVILFGSALVMWWNRVLNPFRKRLVRAQGEPEAVEATTS